MMRKLPNYIMEWWGVGEAEDDKLFAGDGDEGNGKVEYDKWQSPWSLKENMTNWSISGKSLAPMIKL